jgi:glucose/mannose transport system permease protein
MATAATTASPTAMVARKKAWTWQRVVSRTLLYGALILLALYFLMPIYVLLVTAIKPYERINPVDMWKLPRAIDFTGLTVAWAKVYPNFINSILITVPAAVISSFIGSINGYIFAKWKFKGSDTIFILFLVGMFLPYQGILVPLVQTLQVFHLYGTLAGLILTHCIFGIPITALMFRAYYAGVPNELLDAGRIDGCGFFGIYRHILLPIAFPAFAVVGIWQFTSIWNDYLMAVVILSRPTLAPVMVAVKGLAGTYDTSWNIQMSGALIAAAPTILVYLLLGKFFMQGLLAGSVKG